MVTIDEDAVRARAYQLWEESGCVPGHHEEHWRRAQAECAAAAEREAGQPDRVGPVTLSGTDAEGAVVLAGPDGAVPPGIDGEISRPLVEARSKPRRWPTPIVDI